MYYHIRLDPMFFDPLTHDECTDMNARIEWDFRSLEKALTMIAREFGSGAAYWQIHYGVLKSEATPDIMLLEKELREALESGLQYIFMAFKENIPQQQSYGCFVFLVSMHDETETPPLFPFIEEAEGAIQRSTSSDFRLLDFYKCPVDATRIESMTPLYNHDRNEFTGVLITLKGGGRIHVSDGVNQEGERVMLGESGNRGIDKHLIDKVLPLLTKGPILRGFYVQLKSGGCWCLPIGVPPDKSIFERIQMKSESVP